MELKTIDIKGKDYVTVNERIRAFRENYKNYSLESEILSMENGTVTIKAIVRNEDGRVIATGHAQEKENSSYINKTSYIENCETSAWGRALGNLGIGVDTSIASYEEVSNAINNQKGNEEFAQRFSPTCEKCKGQIKGYGSKNPAEIAAYTKKRYGQSLCKECAGDARKAAETR